MKRIVFFLPAIVFTVAVLFLNLLLKTASPLWYAWVLLLWACGILLVKGKFWGSVFGLAPAIHILCMSTQYTGQVIDLELPLGLVTAVYVLGCGFWVWKKVR